MPLIHQAQRYLRRAIRYPCLIAILILGLLIAVLMCPLKGVLLKRLVAKYWFQGLLWMLGVRHDIKGVNFDVAGRFFVANHISWLDIAVISASMPICFLSKSEVREWPLIGLLAQFVGTIFIKRASRREIKEVNGRIYTTLMLGHSVCVFPEGTTTRGNSLAPFHSSAFQAALDAKAKVTPISLKYLDANRVQTDRIAYVNDMTFMRSLDQIIVEKSHVAEVTFLPSIEARSMKRGDVSDMSRKMISSSLFN